MSCWPSSSWLSLLLFTCGASADAEPAAGAASPPASCPATTAGLTGAPEDPRLRGDLLVALKSARRIGHYRRGVLVTGECWPMALAVGAPTGDKEREGDRRTPEGFYRTSDKPWSRFENAIAVHYPNRADARRGRDAGRIDDATYRRIVQRLRAGEKPPQQTALGGEILIHGGGAAVDWTAGCVALDDDDLKALREALPAGMATTILILP